MGSFSVFSPIHWIITAGIIWLIYSVIRGLSGHNSGEESICPSCGTQGKAKIMVKGSLAIEIILWLCFIVPGLIYTTWRLTTKYEG